jgi:CrcB protein
MARTLWIALGGALGTCARYLLGNWLLRVFGAAFPYHTLTVNALGSFLLGFLMHVGLTTQVVPPALRVVLATGVFGGFTTYSSFNYETLTLLQQGAWRPAFVYLGATILGCLLSGFLGFASARWIVGN